MVVVVGEVEVVEVAEVAEMAEVVEEDAEVALQPLPLKLLNRVVQQLSKNNGSFWKIVFATIIQMKHIRKSREICLTICVWMG